MYQIMIKIAKDYSVRTILDASGSAFKSGINADPFMIKPNLSETKDIFDKRFSFEGYREKKLLPLFKELNKKIEIIVLTLEKHGAIAFIENKVFKIITPKIKTVNSVGSGDAFIGGFAYGICNGMQFLDSISIGVAAGAANAAIWDTCFCTKDQVLNLVDKVVIKELS